jgi:hypothetical protein
MAGDPACQTDLVEDGAAAAAAREQVRGLRLRATLLEAGIGGLMFAIALWFWFGADAIQSDSRGLMSPVAFPEAISVLLALCAVLMIVRGLAPLRHAQTANYITVERPWFVLVAMGMTVIYPLLMGAFGYYLATALWLPPFLWVAGYRKPLGLAGATVGFLIFTRVIFQQLLGTPMP